MAPRISRATAPDVKATNPGLLVAGTDTGVGKTLISCALLETAARQGWPLLPFKPSESGCPGGRPQDAAALRLASGHRDLSLRQVCPFPFRPPVAPAAAAHLAGTELTLAAIRRAARALAGGKPLLVESAGGLLSPYSRSLTAADLAIDLGLPVLLISRNGLGTINHTALAVAEIRRRGIPLLGLILVTTRPERGLSAQQNAHWIEALTGVRPETTVPHFPRDPLGRTSRYLAREVAPTLLTRAQVARRNSRALAAKYSTAPRALRFPFSGR
jgi:dethiobiotin synthetase